MAAVPEQGSLSSRLLDTLSPSARAVRSRSSCPVISCLVSEDVAESVELANASNFGLVAGARTKNVGRARRLVRALKADHRFINHSSAGGGVESPFGGYDRSGINRMKSMAGALEYAQLKMSALG